MFALEVCSRFGIEYFEHTIEAIFCGVLTVGLFRTALGLELNAIWSLDSIKTESASPRMLLIGAGIGSLGAFVGFLFTHGHHKVMSDNYRNVGAPNHVLGRGGVSNRGNFVT